MEYVAGVALRFMDGFIYSLPRPYRHHHLLHTLQDKFPDRNPYDPEQGFIDNHGNYLTRKEAYRLANYNGQYNRNNGCTLEKLFSEDVW